MNGTKAIGFLSFPVEGDHEGAPRSTTEWIYSEPPAFCCLGCLMLFGHCVGRYAFLTGGNAFQPNAWPLWFVAFFLPPCRVQLFREDLSFLWISSKVFAVISPFDGKIMVKSPLEISTCFWWLPLKPTLNNACTYKDNR